MRQGIERSEQKTTSVSKWFDTIGKVVPWAVVAVQLIVTVLMALPTIGVVGLLICLAIRRRLGSALFALARAGAFASIQVTPWLVIAAIVPLMLTAIDRDGRHRLCAGSAARAGHAGGIGAAGFAVMSLVVRDRPAHEVAAA